MIKNDKLFLCNDITQVINKWNLCYFKKAFFNIKKTCFSSKLRKKFQNPYSWTTLNTDSCLVSTAWKCPYSEFFWFVFSRIWTEILRFSPYSVRMRENTDQKNSEYGHFSHSVHFQFFFRLSLQLPALNMILVMQTITRQLAHCVNSAESLDFFKSGAMKNRSVSTIWYWYCVSRL